jgi:hypothetical protein
LDKVVRNTGLMYGLIGSTFIVAIYVYLSENQVLSGGFYAVLIYLVPMLLAIIAQIHSKFKLNQFIDVKSAMAAYVVCIALICLTKVVMVYLIFNELYPEMQDVAAQAYAERRAELKAQGVEIGEMQADFSLKASLVNIAIEFLGYLIPGFIIALVIKKKPAAA